MTTLFLVEAGTQYDGDRHLYTAASVEGALREVDRLMSSKDELYGQDLVWIKAVSPGPGSGVWVASWHEDGHDGPWPEYPDDGEGPPTGPEPKRVWRREL